MGADRRAQGDRRPYTQMFFSNDVGTNDPVGFDFDIFNVFNSGTVLGRIYDVSSTEFNNVAEIMNPRIARFGVRLQF